MQEVGVMKTTGNLNRPNDMMMLTFLDLGKLLLKKLTRGKAKTDDLQKNYLFKLVYSYRFIRKTDRLYNCGIHLIHKESRQVFFQHFE